MMRLKLGHWAGLISIGISACAVNPAANPAPTLSPFLALRSDTSPAIPEAELSGSLHLQNGCVVFRREGMQEASTPVFDNRSRVSIGPSGFVIHRPQGDLVEGKRYTFGGGGINPQTSLIQPVPNYCPQNLVLLGGVVER
jgi:hypothetical protein